MDIIEKTKKAINEFLRSRQFSSIEEAQAALDDFLWRLNRTPHEEFCGLSSYHMRAFLRYPFSSPHVVRFNLKARPPLEAPLVRLLILLLGEIAREPQGLKTTAKGNLPRDVCRRLDEEFHTEKSKRFRLRDKFPIMQEEDFRYLHAVRLVAEMAGFIRRYKKRFILTKLGREIVKNGITMEHYYRLFQTYTLDFNWAYMDFFDELPIIQESFIFTLYLLKLYGDEYREEDFYAGLFIRAFPSVLKQVNHCVNTPEDEVKLVYKIRSLQEFAVGLGFAEKEEKDFFLSRLKTEVRKAAFLDEFIEFPLEVR